MIAIRKEIDEVAAGTWPKDDNPLRDAPHTAADVTGAWDRAYERAQGAFPAGSASAADPGSKYWPPVRRIDGAYGDRNLVCSCPSPEAYES
jgi:glycine dehydrogenase